MGALRTPRGSRHARPLLFLGVVSLLALPFGLAGLLADGTSFVLGLPVSVLLIVVPATTATWFVSVENGVRPGAGRLWTSLLELSPNPSAWAAALAIPPAVLAIYLGAGSVLDVEHTGPVTRLSMLPWYLLLYLLGAVLEEVGWTGYATAPLVRRLGLLGAGLVIGAVWASVHWVPWMVMGHGPSDIIAMTASTMLLRLLITWVYVRGGYSLPLAVVLHAGSNTAQTYPTGLADSDPSIWLLGILAVCAVVATIRIVVVRPSRQGPGATIRRTADVDRS